MSIAHGDERTPESLLDFDKFKWNDDEGLGSTSTAPGENGELLCHFTFTRYSHESFSPEIIGGAR